MNGRSLKSTAVDLLGEELGAEAGGLLAEAHHQLGAHDALGEAGEVLDLGGEHELAAGLVAGADGSPSMTSGREVGAGGVDGGGEAGGAGADDDDVADVGLTVGSWLWCRQGGRAPAERAGASAPGSGGLRGA